MADDFGLRLLRHMLDGCSPNLASVLLPYHTMVVTGPIVLSAVRLESPHGF